MKRLVLILMLCAPAWAANIWTGDPNVLYVQNFEVSDSNNPASGNWTDSNGSGLIFYNSGSPQVDDVNNYYKQGAGSGDFVCRGQFVVGSYISTSDATLSAAWPIKSTFAGTVKLSYCAWFRPDLLPTAGANDNVRCLFGKYNNSSGERVVSASVVWDGSKAVLQYVKGYNSGGSATATNHTRALVSGQWYHIGLTYDDTDHSVVMRLWDATAGTVYEVTDTHANAMEPDGGNEDLMIGNLQITAAQYYEFDGWMDEVVFFNDVLTSAEIDEIRQGIYGNPTSGGDWWYRRRHN